MGKSEERTVGNDRIRVVRHEGGEATITHLVLGGEGGHRRRRGKLVFDTIASIDVPAALVDFLVGALGAKGPRCEP